MSHELSAPTGSEQQVTASDLVRHFGLWQERAGRAPVYILHRGRPRLVLTSLDVMEALCAPAAREEAPPANHAAGLLDADDRVTIVVDDRGTIRMASRGARARFGTAAAKGHPVEQLAAVAGELLADAVGRVARTGAAETLELSWQRYPGRRAQIHVEPFPDGCLIRSDDLNTADALRSLEREQVAVLAAGEAAGAIVLRIGLRGHVESPPPALSELTGAPAAALRAARFVSLFAVADRVAVGEALEATIAEVRPVGLRAGLLVRGAEARQVSLGMAPVTEAAQVIGVVATLAGTAGPA